MTRLHSPAMTPERACPRRTGEPLSGTRLTINALHAPAEHLLDAPAHCGAGDGTDRLDFA